MERIMLYINNLITQISYTDFTFTGIIEILIIAVLAYRIVLWIMNTKAWMLFKGIVIIVVFIMLAKVFNMTTILYLAEISMNVLALTAVVVFQPEIRRALENLGQKDILSVITPFEKKDNARFTTQTLDGIVIACTMMSKVKTGALIIVERTVKLAEIASTGIELDCLVSNQILVNIFEHNTPLHDGSVLVRGDRILAATCYLPLSDNMSLDKHLGTRHRAAVGMSEASDAIVIVVSEETGNISIAEAGNLRVGVSVEELRTYLNDLRIETIEPEKTSYFVKAFKGGKDDKRKNPS